MTRLTSESGQELFPSLSADARLLAYSADGHIFIQDSSSKSRVDLTKDSISHNWQPAFSPDGKRIAFRSEREGGGMFVVPASGGMARRLTNFGYNPAWSPDGKEILCATETFVDPESRQNSSSSLWAVNVLTGEKRQITRLETISDAVQPQWSPHAYRVAYWSAQAGTPSVWTASASGGDPVPVAQDGHVNWNPVWSPEGRFLYFTSDRSGEMELWRVRMDERTGKPLSAPQAVTREPGFGGFISVSGDGRHIAYVKSSRRANLQKMAFDPSREVVTGQPAAVTQGTRLVFGPDLSPDGKWFVFFSWGQREEIFLAGADGKGPWPLTNDDYRNRWPRWSPDGKRIAFHSNRSGKYQIWAVRPDASGLEPLTDSAEPVTFPVWSPDGRFLAYSSDTGTFLMTTAEPWQRQLPVSLPPWREPGGRFEAFSWSPDGRRLAGHLQRGAAEADPAGIVIYSLADRTYRALTNAGSFPVWLSDSQRLLFSHNDRIFLIDTRSAKAHEILSTTPPVVFGLSRDDRLLYFTSISVESDIWMSTLH